MTKWDMIKEFKGGAILGLVLIILLFAIGICYSAECGPIHGTMVTSVPKTGFCKVGIVRSGMVTKDRRTWTCEDSTETISCYAVTVPYCLAHCRICIPGDNAFCPDEVITK